MAMIEAIKAFLLLKIMFKIFLRGIVIPCIIFNVSDRQNIFFIVSHALIIIGLIE